MTTSEGELTMAAPGGVVDARAVVEQIDADIILEPDGVILPIETRGLTLCSSYKEAKYLAAARRRSGSIETRHVRAVYLISHQTWCVK